MIERSITIFPEFENGRLIDELRSKYDPLYQLIPPHITLVFPFTSDLTAEQLHAHIESVLLHEKLFSIKLQGVTGEGSEYLFLNVKKGNDEIIRLHDLLYTGRLREFLFRELTYVPHLTVGRFNDTGDFKAALNETAQFTEEFTTTVNHIVVEKIEESGLSQPEFYVDLRN
ncbi:2'-5' RNA ligase family protein [Rossellomorea vietnamensis]|uniref:2'-5' RNA ligase family protein n=1 Tax=Rossellomorea vietnamensis TaxID=218284 RepID=A0A5D4NKV3_9BACI|nr:2'-5' RNA ligase family protein [Rossellomorea vietnamensis]TYS14520.1 2'-5' RNA ligase family protein [Rossellomorea vietnamensis]